MLQEYVARIPYAAAPDNWPVHVAGHPPGALLFFVALVRIGLGGGLAAGLVVDARWRPRTAVAVLVTLRALGAEARGPPRRAVPGARPGRDLHGVSADAMFAAVAAWGLAALAAGRDAPAAGALVGWAVRRRAAARLAA